MDIFLNKLMFFLLRKYFSFLLFDKSSELIFILSKLDLFFIFIKYLFDLKLYISSVVKSKIISNCNFLKYSLAFSYALVSLYPPL